MEADVLHDLFRSQTPTPTPMEGDAETPTLAMQDVNYRIKYRSGSWWKGACFRQHQVKHVLRDVTLALPAGQLIGLVGSSGSGKTSLLDVIAHRTEGVVTGLMTYDGVRCTRDFMKQRLSYVIQADRLLPNLTVRETLTYTAFLKLPGFAKRSRVDEVVNSVIHRMGLRAVADSRVGGAVVRGVSGGEKRRVTIALHLLKDPDILLLDEPTTGLDSSTARNLVTGLQNLARQGKLVVLSIHQPRSDIAKLLDKTALMCQGQVLYYGSSSKIVPYFSQLGFPCPTYANPLDTYIDIISIDRRNNEQQRITSRRVRELRDAYEASELLAENQAKVREHMDKRRAESRSGPANRRIASPGWPRIFSTVINRMNLNLFRDRYAFLCRCLLLPLYVPFLVLFLGRLKHNQSSVQDRIGLLYQTVQVPPYVGIVNAVALFPQLRDHFYREGLDGLYSSSTFLLAYALHIVPFVAVASGIFSSLLYWTTGMYPDTDRFLMHIVVTFCLHLGGELLTVGTMGVFQNPQLANTTTALLLTASGLVASGFLRSLQNMVWFLRYLSWASIHKYASEIVVANEFHKLNLTCEEVLRGLPCLTDGDDFIAVNYPGAVQHVDRNFELLITFTCAFLLLAMFAFRVVGLKVLH